MDVSSEHAIPLKYVFQNCNKILKYYTSSTLNLHPLIISSACYSVIRIIKQFGVVFCQHNGCPIQVWGPLQGHAQKQRLEDQRINKYITRNSCYTTVSSAI